MLYVYRKRKVFGQWEASVFATAAKRVKGMQRVVILSAMAMNTLVAVGDKNGTMKFNDGDKVCESENKCKESCFLYGLKSILFTYHKDSFQEKLRHSLKIPAWFYIPFRMPRKTTRFEHL